MTVTFPEGVEGEGNVRVAFLLAIAGTGGPTLTEMGTAVELVCYITGDGFQPGGEQVTNTDRRLCSRQVFGVPGAITYSLEEVSYVYDPQDPEDLLGENEAYASLAPNTKGFIVIRWGLPYEDAWAADQIVDVFPVTMGAQFKNAPVASSGGGGGGGDGGTTKLTVRQTPFVSGPARLDQELVAP